MTLSGNILITGGTGTLGKAILATAERERWAARFTVYSRSELLQAQLRQRFPHVRCVQGDVADYERLSAAVAGHDMVIHAAAVKRIPEAEQQPQACYTTNVYGSQNVIRACIQHGVQRCIGVSTDKAVRAVTAYGASKLAMEKLFQAQPLAPTTFTLVRYGNVVASRGSVIPLWREQASRGQPLTITNARCTRFWMAPSDAVGLIVQAARQLPGQIVVPKMGALSLSEMAQIIAPGCATIEMGLRSCEKVHEDLIHADELVIDAGSRFIVGDKPWTATTPTTTPTTGTTYTSEHAPRLSADDFLAMLEEAESYD